MLDMDYHDDHMSQSSAWNSSQASLGSTHVQQNVDPVSDNLRRASDQKLDWRLASAPGAPALLQICRKVVTRRRIVRALTGESESPDFRSLL